ncbi:MAG: TolC family protein [Verrucomicrobia bacterium]|nr:TolC family protein [Verrucomicrobiota bacterium]
MKFLLLALSLLAALPLAASAADRTLTLADALARVEAGHPFFRTRDAESRLAAARATHATARPAAEVSLQLENALGNGELSALRSLEATLQLSRALDLADLRSARAAVAAARNSAEHLAWEERRRELHAEAACRFIRVVAAQSELSATREFADLAARTADATVAHARANVASPADVARARLALADARLEAEHAEHLLESARHSLASLWGASTPDFDTATASLAALPAAASYETLIARLGATPAQARFAALARWRGAQERLARRESTRGELRWSAGLRRVEATDNFGFVAGLGYTLPARAAAEATAAEARAERDRTVADGETALLAVRTTLFALHQELGHARLAHDTARDELIPTARAWLAAIDAGLAAGRYSPRDQLEARAALHSARRRQIQAAAEYHATLVEIEHLLAAPASS